MAWSLQPTRAKSVTEVQPWSWHRQKPWVLITSARWPASGLASAAFTSITGLSLDAVRDQARARIPLGRYGDPDEMGRVIAFLLSPAASYLNGVILAVDGGMIRSLP